jgi:hypothetical protein
MECIKLIGELMTDCEEAQTIAMTKPTPERFFDPAVSMSMSSAPVPLSSSCSSSCSSSVYQDPLGEDGGRGSRGRKGSKEYGDNEER